MNFLVYLLILLQAGDMGTTIYGLHIGAMETNPIVKSPVVAIAIKVPITTILAIGMPKLPKLT